MFVAIEIKSANIRTIPSGDSKDYSYELTLNGGKIVTGKTIRECIQEALLQAGEKVNSDNVQQVLDYLTSNTPAWDETVWVPNDPEMRIELPVHSDAEPAPSESRGKSERVPPVKKKRIAPPKGDSKPQDALVGSLYTKTGHDVYKDIVLIEWVDSKGMERWEYFDELEPLLPDTCYSVGFLIEDHVDYKTIALGLGTTQVLGRTTIPMGCIKRITRLTPARD